MGSADGQAEALLEVATGEELGDDHVEEDDLAEAALVQRTERGPLADIVGEHDRAFGWDVLGRIG